MHSILQQLMPINKGHRSQCKTRTVKRTDFEQWRRRFIFDALQGQKFGASFCQYFGIQDYRIQFAPTVAAAESIIEREWLHSA